MLTGAAGILLTLAGPSLAASSSQRGLDAYASTTTDRSGAYYYGPQDAQGRAIAAPRQAAPSQYRAAPYVPGENYPYPDRPYGDPDRD